MNKQLYIASNYRTQNRWRHVIPSSGFGQTHNYDGVTPMNHIPHFFVNTYISSHNNKQTLFHSYRPRTLVCHITSLSLTNT